MVNLPQLLVLSSLLAAACATPVELAGGHGGAEAGGGAGAAATTGGAPAAGGALAAGGTGGTGAGGRGGAAGAAGHAGTGASGTGGVSGTGGTGGAGGGTAGVGGASATGGTGGTGSGCGDGSVDPGEDCDDHGTAPGDGCSATCQWETNCTAKNTHPILTCGQTASGSFEGKYSDVATICGATFKYQDVVFEFRSTAAQHVTVTNTVSPDRPDTAMFLMRGSCHTALCVADSRMGSDEHTLEFDAEAGVTYYIDFEAPSFQPSYSISLGCR